MIFADEYSAFTEEQWDWLITRYGCERLDEAGGENHVP